MISDWKCYDGSEVESKALDLTKLGFNKEEFQKTLQDFLKNLNNSYFSVSGNYAWDESILDDNQIFSGSTRLFFEKDFDVFTDYKKSLGDIDIIIDKALTTPFTTFIEGSVGNTFLTTKIKSVRKSQGQVHILVDIPCLDIVDLQIDFEFNSFENGKPTEFSVFSHYSSWDDLTLGIKGVFNKLLLRAIASSFTCKGITVVSKKTGKPVKAPLNSDGSLSFMTFYVSGGLRDKYAPYLDSMNNQIEVDGKPAFIELSTSESKYLENPTDIFAKLFWNNPSPADVSSLYSFIKLAKTLYKFYDKPFNSFVLNKFIELCFGSKKYHGRLAQNISGLSLEGEIQQKLNALQVLGKTLDLPLGDVDDFVTQYRIERGV